MHNIFKDKLKDSYGESKFVVAINVDVRNFSTFCKSVDSAESALFVKKIFQNILSNYFPDASFFKSTGDGLILIYDIVEDQLTTVSNQIISQAIKLINSFDKLCSKEPMINFDVPNKCGIGISRGPATCLRTPDVILDYFGDTLNIASRLMECAKPTGIIIDARFKVDLLVPTLLKQFEPGQIYFKQQPANEGISIWLTKGKTTIPSEYLNPTKREIEYIEEEHKFRKLQSLAPIYLISLSNKPLNIKEITVDIQHDFIKNNRVMKSFETRFGFNDFTYQERAGKHFIRININELIKRLNENGLKPSMSVLLKVAYPK